MIQLLPITSPPLPGFSPPRASARGRAFGNSSSLTSATRIRAAPMAARSGSSSPGASGRAPPRSPTAKQRLAAIRMLFDCLVTGQIVPTNPAASVRGPKHVVKVGKTPVLEPAEARALLDSIDVTTPVGLRDCALIGLMVYSYARVGAALAMKVEDVYVQNRGLWVRLHEKGGKRHEMSLPPQSRSLPARLSRRLRIGRRSEGVAVPNHWARHGAAHLDPLPQANAYAMIRRRAAAADIKTKIGNHSFRATGITAYLKNGGTLEKAAAMANHASMRTTQLYDRRRDEMSLDEVERVVI
jgi:site-specific recombinase XerD